MADDGDVVVDEAQVEETKPAEEDNGELDVTKALKVRLLLFYLPCVRNLNLV